MDGHTNGEMDEIVELTERDVVRFMESVGAPIHETCPRCGSSRWNEDGKNKADDAVVTTSRAHVQEALRENPSLTLDIYCGNCGFTESFRIAVLLNFLGMLDE